ncbi:MAG: alanine--tRNA ligase [Terriglobia bacterium]
MTGKEIRQRFLEYFERHRHHVVKSSSLVPANDPTLLFTNAGMNQFKDVFLGNEKRDYVRATSSQKCVRAGGKHNDLENVGKTARHHTFFEMLGNFSFGDYFKNEAIPLAWRLVTEEFGIVKDKLWITIYQADDEAFEIWNRQVGIPAERIHRLGEKDNFWAMGETGPCGPCSEIHYDQGAEASEWGHQNCSFPCDCGRYVEIWNLVFMQYERNGKGELNPLPRPSIDTGMGLERITAVLQGKKSNFDTDLLRPLIDEAAELAQKEYGMGPATDVSLRVIADHSRAAAFLISDGVIPSNEGRGYVLRKILRRAIRHGKAVGIEEPFLFAMTGHVIELMKEAYPDLLLTRGYVAKVVKNEEQRFSSTIRIAIDQFGEILTKSQKAGAEPALVSGEVMFKFYDTFGLPLDLMQELASEFKVGLDEGAFQQKLDAQRERGKASWKESAQSSAQTADTPTRQKTEFLGYSTLMVNQAKILAILVEGKNVPTLQTGETGKIFLDRTPFYAETGGQVGDTGTLEGDNSEGIVHNTYPFLPGYTAHETKCILGQLSVGDTVAARVDGQRRASIARNHTATHLLHASLRNLIGIHVKQAGSLVAPDRLRFDFSHYAPLSPEELIEIESLVNAEVLQNRDVTTSIKPINEAISEGAMALFGEKYGQEVRVVAIDPFSRELCGGTHVRHTGDIGLFKVVNESGIAAGIRRIEAITGDGALQRFREDESILGSLEVLSRGMRDDLLQLMEKHQNEIRSLEKEVETLRYRLAKTNIQQMLNNAQTVQEVKILTSVVDDLDKGGLRNLADELKAKLDKGVIVLATTHSGKVTLIATVTSNLIPTIHAGKIVKEISQIVGGSGGGRPEMAEAGGKEPAKIGEALNAVKPIVAKALGA